MTRLVFLAGVALVGVGLLVVIADPDLRKKVLGLNLFQTGVLLFLVGASFRRGGRAPLVSGTATDSVRYVDPLPHVLVLTAIVVGVSVTAVALALVVRVGGGVGE
ncbi:cation:proton antiporter subunit C [Halomicrococcus sp. SG-WS-1]|uniref:cation:proton antiporter subunit C n=1 Tax=Halomicrococcus sp. SG-WS-1 TaxID=3439057 RepID=UPI003F7B194C